MGKPYLHLLVCLLMACNSTPTTSDATTNVDSLKQPNDHYIMGEEFAKKQVEEVLNGKGQPFTWDTLIKSPSTAVAVAEPILFDVFGKEMTLNEKPYEVYLIDGYWYIAGTIPKDMKGGAFEVILSAKDGKIIRFTHYK